MQNHTSTTGLPRGHAVEEFASRIAALEVEMRNVVSVLDRLTSRHTELDNGLREMSDRHTRALTDLTEKFFRSLQEMTEKSANEMKLIKESSASELKSLRENSLRREDFAWIRGVVTTALSALVTAGISWLVLGPHH
jgi:DNA anti-recombination protein RmuC